MGEFKSINETVNFLEECKKLNSKDTGVNFNGGWISEIDLELLTSNKSRLDLECSIERSNVDFNNKIDEIIDMVKDNEQTTDKGQL